MIVNKFNIRYNGSIDKTLDIPFNVKWDYLDIDSSIDQFEVDIVREVIGEGNDFEVSRFSHEPNDDLITELNYEFYFYSGGSLNNIDNWLLDYRSEGFTTGDIYYYNNNFINSFFKLDLYDTVDDKKQKNYITIIIPTQQGLTMDTFLQRKEVSIKKPKFVLDYNKNKEGFFIYWLRSRDFLDISRFYMSAKFYDAKRGVFVRLMNMPQASLNSKHSFDQTKYFYYQVDLNYNDKTYLISNQNEQRIGIDTPIKWFEYVNPL